MRPRVVLACFEHHFQAHPKLQLRADKLQYQLPCLTRRPLRLRETYTSLASSDCLNESDQVPHCKARLILHRTIVVLLPTPLDIIQRAWSASARSRASYKSDIFQPQPAISTYLQATNRNNSRVSLDHHLADPPRLTAYTMTCQYRAQGESESPASPVCQEQRPAFMLYRWPGSTAAGCCQSLSPGTKTFGLRN
jgi:hypothetical protein